MLFVSVVVVVVVVVVFFELEVLFSLFSSPSSPRGSPPPLLPKIAIAALNSVVSVTDRF